MGLSTPVFTILADLVEERAGLHYGPPEMDLFSGKVSNRATEAGFESLLDYYYFLRYDGGADAEMARLVEALVVNETYFFREVDQLDALIEHVLVPAAREKTKLRVWCAACSTGEEPLSVAMLLAERGLLARVDIVASDVSERALARAQAGDFGRRATRQLPHRMAARWLHQGAGHRVTVDPEISAAVSWRRVNLIERREIEALGRFDAILCRNVLIYFSDSGARTVVESLVSTLEPSGALLVGVSESLLRFGTALDCEERGGTFLYRKPTHE